MSSTGTRKARDMQSRINEALTEADKNFIANLKIFSGASDSIAGVAGNSVNSSPQTPTGNYLARQGDSMIGPLALGPPSDFRIEIDANNTINISSDLQNPQFSSNIQLDSIQPNSFVLDIIAGAVFDGQILVLRTFAPSTPFTISQGTVGNGGNILTGDSNDLTVGDLQSVILMFDASLLINANTGGTWRVLSSTTTSGGTTFPILWPKEDLTPAAASSFTIDLSQTDGNAKQVQFPAGDVSLQIIGDPVNTVGQEVHVLFIQDGIGGRSLTSVDSAIKNGLLMDTLLDKAANAKTMFKLVTLDGGVSYHAELVDLVSAGGEFFGPWTGDHDAGGFSLNNLLSIDIEDSGGSSKLSISGPLGVGARFAFVSGDTVFFTENITDILSITASGLNLLTHDIVMGAGGNIAAGGAGEGMTNIGHLDFIDNQASPPAAVSLFSDGTALIANTNGNQGNVFITPATENLIMGSNDITSSAGNGMTSIGHLDFIDNLATPAAAVALFSDGTDLFANTGGGVVNLSDIGGEFFGPWTATHNAGNQSLTNLASVAITDTSGNSHGLLQGILSTGVRLTLTTGEQFNIFDNITNIFQIDNSGLNLFGNNLGMGTGGNIVAGGAGEGMTNVGHIDFIDNSATPAAATALFSDGVDMFVNTGGNVVNLSDIVPQSPWLTNINADGFSLNNLLSIDIEDSGGSSKLSISGPLGVGARFAFVSGDTVFFTENITDILSITASGLNLLTHDILMGTGGNIIAGGAGEGVTNVGHLDFIDNVSTPASSLSIYSDGTDILANTGGGVVNLSDIGSGFTPEGIQETEPPLSDINFDGDNVNIFISNGKQGYNVGNISSFVEDIVYYFPIYLGKRARVTTLGWNNIAAATGTITFAMGLYSNIGNGVNYPNSRIVQDTSATVTASSQAARTNSLSPTNLEIGLYWIGIIITDLQLGSIATCSKHENSGANTSGYFDDDPNTDVFLPIFGFTDGATTLPSTAVSEMVPIVDNPQAVFARFIPNTS